MTLDPLAQLSIATMAAVVVIFLISLFLLRRIYFVPLIAVMEKRAARIEAARVEKAAAEELMANARREAESLLATATAEANRVEDAAKQEIADHRRAALDTARAESEAVLARGKEALAVLTRAESTRLADELFGCAAGTLRKVVDTVDETAVKYAVTRVLIATEGPHE